MIDAKDKMKMGGITIAVDLFLIWLLITVDLSLFDKYFLYFILCAHLAFYPSLYFYNKAILDILHYLIFISLAISVGLKNIYLLAICLLLTIVIQLLWIFEKRCLLCEENETFGFTNEVEVFMLLLTVGLSYKIGKISNQTQNIVENLTE